MPEQLPEIEFASVGDWRKWLQRNQKSSAGLWFVFYKKSSGKPSVDYGEALDEALCFGWIDSILRKLDECRYARKFTPRRDDSEWSEANKKRVEKLLESHRMTEAGLAKVRAAQENGRWVASCKPKFDEATARQLRAALATSKKARGFFESLPPSQQKQYVLWIGDAKREATRLRRLRQAREMLQRGEKPGMI
jgi:uncharacterized protein YdeI (YjbR/CyaY-like superfamily)